MGIHLKRLVQYRRPKNKHLKAARAISHLTRLVIHGWEKSRDVHHRITTSPSEGEENPPLISEVIISSPFVFHARLQQLRALVFCRPFVPVTVSPSSWASGRVACRPVGAPLTYRCDSGAPLICQCGGRPVGQRAATGQINPVTKYPLQWGPPSFQKMENSRLWTQNQNGEAQ